MLASARKVRAAARFAGQCGNCPPAGMAGGWRFCVTARSWPKCRAGVHARRWGLAVSLGRCGTMQASSPTKHRARLCRVCGISPPQAGNAPLRLRLAAHPPSGLRCPHRTARAEARLCSATAALPRSGKDRSGERLAPAGAVSEANWAAGPALRPEIGRSYAFYRRTGDNKRSDGRLPHEKQLSPPQAALDSAAPCRGAVKPPPLERLPCKGSWRQGRLRGAAPGSANILPGHRKPSRPCGITEPRGAALTQNRSVTPLPSPAGVNARPTI